MNKHIAVIVLVSGVGCLQGAQEGSTLQIQISLWQAGSPNTQFKCLKALAAQGAPHFNKSFGNSVVPTRIPEDKHTGRLIRSGSFGKLNGANKHHARRLALVLKKKDLTLVQVGHQVDKTPVEPGTCRRGATPSPHPLQTPKS